MFSRQLTIGQAVGFILSMLTIVGGAFVEMQVQVARLETRQDELEQRLTEARKTEDEHYKELKHSNQLIYDKLVEIQLELQNKQNRP